MGNLLSCKNFNKLYWAGTLSELGSFITETALIIHVDTISHSNKGLLGFTRGIFLAFFSIGSIIGGPLGEKYDRRKILIWTNLLRVPFILLIMFLGHIPSIILCNGLIGFFTGIFNPSRQAIINEIVGPTKIQDANSLFGSTMATLHMLAPLLGGILYSYFRDIREILSFDLLTYIVGVYLISKILYTPHTKNSEITFTLKGNFLDGLSFIKSRPDLLGIFSSSIFGGICIGFLIPLLLPFVKEFLHASLYEYGLLLGFFGLGGTLGGFFSKYLEIYFKSHRIIFLCVILEPLMMFFWTLTVSIYLSTSIFFLWGIVVFTRITCQLNHISRSVEKSMLTRVHSLLDMSFLIPNISSGILVGFFGNFFNTHDFLIYVSYFFILSVIVRIFLKDLKGLYSYKGID